MTKPIFVSQGKSRYVGGTVTDEYGQDISTATFMMAWGSSSTVPPTTGWVPPSINVQGAGGPSTRLVKLLITNTTPLGNWFMWIDVADHPEDEPMVVPEGFITA